MNRFYLTTTLPYVNSDPHLGFALEMVLADTIVRFQKLQGKEVFFNTGTDEHGLKIYQKALERGISPKEYCDEYAEKFKQLMPALGVLPEIHFIRTTDEHHIKACQEFWKLVDKNGYIEKKNYKVKYCVGCELEKTESDLSEEGKCLVHPHLEIEIREEENYFFKFSAFQKPLLELYEKQPDFVVPDFRFNEIREFVKNGLSDFSISRLKEKMPWGVPVPGDDNHVMYVWFDALINYVSTLGWPEYHPFNSPPILGGEGQNGGEVSNLFQEFWGTKENPNGIQIAGKDNLRQQSAMWQAMLMAAGLPNSKQIIIHGFINSGGQKMSKSLGNVADPYKIIEDLKIKGLNKQQATDALRYYLLKEIPTFEDGDYTWDRFLEVYNSDLANGIGNLTSRILKMSIANSIFLSPGVERVPDSSAKALAEEEGGERSHDSNSPNDQKIKEFISSYHLKLALEEIWKDIKFCDEYIQKEEPFKVVKVDPEKAKKQIEFLLGKLKEIAENLQPFLPDTSQQITNSLKPLSGEIPRLFPRI